ncbi:MAG TPA: hypothetical protein VF808_04730 [Ktedonobacterales bacterium]
MGDTRDASKPPASHPVRQVSRKLPEWGDLEVVALIAQDGVYFPLKLLSFVFLGDVNDRAQRARVQRDPILRELTRVYPVETAGGKQQMVCLERLGIGRWINGVEINRLRPEIRERFLAFQWELTRLADRLLFGESTSGEPLTIARAGPREPRRGLSDDELLTFLQFLARRVGALELDVSQIKRIQLALIEPHEAYTDTPDQGDG